MKYIVFKRSENSPEEANLFSRTINHNDQWREIGRSSVLVSAGMISYNDCCALTKNLFDMLMVVHGSDTLRIKYDREREKEDMYVIRLSL